MTDRRIALFGGSFNPIHWGHIRLARRVLAAGWADEVWLLGSAQHPRTEPVPVIPFPTRFLRACMKLKLLCFLLLRPTSDRPFSGVKTSRPLFPKASFHL